MCEFVEFSFFSFRFPNNGLQAASRRLAVTVAQVAFFKCSHYVRSTDGIRLCAVSSFPLCSHLMPATRFIFLFFALATKITVAKMFCNAYLVVRLNMSSYVCMCVCVLSVCACLGRPSNVVCLALFGSAVRSVIVN